MSIVKGVKHHTPLVFTPHHNEQSTATEIFQQEVLTSSDKNSIRFFVFHRQGGIVGNSESVYFFISFRVER
jgi:hypothetical protein